MTLANGSGHLSIAVAVAVFFICIESPAAGISLDSVAGLYAPDTIQCGDTLELRLRWFGDVGFNITASSNGFRLHDSGSGAVWTYPLGANVGGEWNPDVQWKAYFASVFVNVFPMPLGGGPSDTLGFGGFALFSSIPDCFDSLFAVIPLVFDCPQSGTRFCLDTTWYQPSNIWKWSGSSGANATPSWDGPHCFTTFDPRVRLH